MWGLCHYEPSSLKAPEAPEVASERPSPAPIPYPARPYPACPSLHTSA